MEFLVGLCIGMFMMVYVSFNIKPEELSTLSQTCEVNKGAEKINIDADKYTVKCKDGATFKIDR